MKKRTREIEDEEKNKKMKNTKSVELENLLTRWTVTEEKGKRWSVKLCSAFLEREEEEEGRESFSLLGSCLPIHSLLSKIEEEERVCLINLQNNQNIESNSSTNSTSPPSYCLEKSLWVEKYKPTSYLHLISEEKINREFLSWMKEWDSIVLKKEKREEEEEEKTNFVGIKGEPKKTKVANERVKEKFQRVALLSGPPGLGLYFFVFPLSPSFQPNFFSD